MKSLALLLAFSAVPAAAQNVGHDQHGGTHPTSVEESDSGKDEVGTDPAPAVATDYAADRVFPAAQMEPSRAALLREGQFRTSTLRIERLEYRAVSGRNGYAWDAQAWTGGDVSRFVLSTAGEVETGHKPETFEVSALWRRAIDPYFNFDLGLRHDFHPDPQRIYAVAAISGLAPYWIEVDGQLLISDKGDVHARIEAEHDMRLTQKLILQPAVEIDIAIQDVPALGIGGGIEKIELGARLRWQITRKLAPYLGIHWERKLGGTADFARASGDKVSGTSLLFGIRTWF